MHILLNQERCISLPSNNNSQEHREAHSTLHDEDRFVCCKYGGCDDGMEFSNNYTKFDTKHVDRIFTQKTITEGEAQCSTEGSATECHRGRNNPLKPKNLCLVDYTKERANRDEDENNFIHQLPLKQATSSVSTFYDTKTKSKYLRYIFRELSIPTSPLSHDERKGELVSFQVHQSRRCILQERVSNNFTDDGLVVAGSVPSGVSTDPDPEKGVKANSEVISEVSLSTDNKIFDGFDLSERRRGCQDREGCVFRFLNGGNKTDGSSLAKAKKLGASPRSSRTRSNLTRAKKSGVNTRFVVHSKALPESNAR
jgi:hypothetical protein